MSVSIPEEREDPEADLVSSFRSNALVSSLVSRLSWACSTEPSESFSLFKGEASGAARSLPSPPGNFCPSMFFSEVMVSRDMSRRGLCHWDCSMMCLFQGRPCRGSNSWRQLLLCYCCDGPYLGGVTKLQGEGMESNIPLCTGSWMANGRRTGETCKWHSSTVGAAQSAAGQEKNLTLASRGCQGPRHIWQHSILSTPSLQSAARNPAPRSVGVKEARSEGIVPQLSVMLCHHDCRGPKQDAAGTATAI